MLSYISYDFNAAHTLQSPTVSLVQSLHPSHFHIGCFLFQCPGDNFQITHVAWFSMKVSARCRKGNCKLLDSGSKNQLGMISMWVCHYIVQNEIFPSTLLGRSIYISAFTCLCWNNVQTLRVLCLCFLFFSFLGCSVCLLDHNAASKKLQRSRGR